jgi:hypothetical protein
VAGSAVRFSAALCTPGIHVLRKMNPSVVHDQVDVFFGDDLISQERNLMKT